MEPIPFSPKDYGPLARFEDGTDILLDNLLPDHPPLALEEKVIKLGPQLLIDLVKRGQTLGPTPIVKLAHGRVGPFVNLAIQLLDLGLGRRVLFVGPIPRRIGLGKALAAELLQTPDRLGDMQTDVSLIA